jgi:hypothetical protein
VVEIRHACVRVGQPSGSVLGSQASRGIQAISWFSGGNTEVYSDEASFKMESRPSTDKYDDISSYIVPKGLSLAAFQTRPTTPHSMSCAGLLRTGKPQYSTANTVESQKSKLRGSGASGCICRGLEPCKCIDQMTRSAYHNGRPAFTRGVLSGVREGDDSA